jgi:hypothetical protein
MIQILRSPIARRELQKLAEEMFGDLVKAVVDIQREIIAIGGELHADEESCLLLDGSKQQDLWGINLYPSVHDESMVEFDSMINVRPSQGNRSRSIEDATVRTKIIEIVKTNVVE